MELPEELIIDKFTKIFNNEIAENINNEIKLYLKNNYSNNNYDLYINKVKDIYNILDYTYNNKKIKDLIKKKI